MGNYQLKNYIFELRTQRYYNSNHFFFNFCSILLNLSLCSFNIFSISNFLINSTCRAFSSSITRYDLINELTYGLCAIQNL